MSNKEFEKYLCDNYLAINDVNNPGQLVFKVTDSGLYFALANLATEATLAQLLALSQTGKEFETFTVVDTGNANLVVRQVSIYNSTTNTFDPPIFYKADGTVYTPIGPLIIQDYSGILANIQANTQQTVVLLTPSQKTKGFQRVSNSGIIPAGLKSITIANRGIFDGTVLGVILKPDETVSWSDDGGLDATSYNATNTEFVITTLL